uniref:Putative P450 monooxygenase and putative metallo-beta-lactamase superfamily II n=1 Tax=Penicillium roqueforti TaxID=5082 RepID=A0A1L4BL55_PENRO|nr:putative P450 monooxygenase and putative metallo-beta-lactamase superfamily II [Penicillium roqueforti]
MRVEAGGDMRDKLMWIRLYILGNVGQTFGDMKRYRRLISILKVYFIFILNPPAQVYVQDINLYTMDYLIIIRITAVAVVLYLTRYVCCLYLHLQDVPGPLFAKFTNLQRVWWVKSGRAHEYHRRMHAVYGPAVRFGPNMVSISDPRTIPAIYPSRPGFPKMPAVFNSQDEDLHKRLRSPIAPLYSMTNVVKLESFVDQTLAVLLEQLDGRFLGSNDVPFDLGSWLQYFAFDSMGTLTFSRRYGFLEQGRDMNGILGEIWKFMKRVSVMGQIPWFDEFCNTNPFIALFRSPTGFGVLKVVDKFILQRLAPREKDEVSDEKDMLSQFLNIQASNPDVMPWMAGSDSTANVMRTIMYNLLVHRDTLSRLQDELLESESRNGLSRTCPSWEKVRDLPYLDACVLEALRLHPPFCLPFERVVPGGGLTVCETYLPAGTIVGISPYMANRDKETFGNDADEWRPERWLGLSHEDRKRLENSLLTMIKSQTTIQNPRNISDILDSDASSLGIRSTDIEAIIWSHAHFDHIGDPSTFPLSTELVVGPGIRDSHWPGFPTNPDAINLNSDIQGRKVREISFERTEKEAIKIGSFDALDYFGDGSFYLLNAAGHSIGHIGALARVTTSPDSFVFMGGDSCHHAGVLRPSKYLPCPSHSRHIPLSSESESVFTLSPVLPSDYDAALKTVDNIKELDAYDNVFLILAHDSTLKGNMDFYPLTINDWKAKGYGKQTKWLFYKDLEDAMEGTK